MKILVLENTPSLSEGIRQYIATSEIRSTIDFFSLKEMLAAEPFDCVILEISSLDYVSTQPVESIKRISKRIGLVLVADEDVLSQRIQALTSGADDYLTRPFDISELAARIISLSRRVNLSAQEDLIFGSIRVDMQAKTVYVDQTEVDLTKKELELLQYFIEHKNTVIRKENLVAFLNGQSKDVRDAIDLIYAHIKNLKKKLRAAGCEDYLKTIYGVGYKWELR